MEPVPIVSDRRRFERRVWWGVAVAMVLLSFAVGYLAWSRVAADPIAGNRDDTSSESGNAQSSSTTAPVSSVSRCLEAVRSAVPRASESPDLEAMLWSLDTCVTLDDWDRALAEISPEVAAEPVSAVFYCQSDYRLQKALLCLEAIRTGLVKPLPPSDGASQSGYSIEDEILFVQRMVPAYPGNRLFIKWFSPEMPDDESTGVPFIYKISGPIAAPMTGTAAEGDSVRVRVPGWTLGMTIRVEVTSTEDSSRSYSFPYTYVDVT